MSNQDLDAYSQAHLDRFVGELIEFCRIPSISTDPAHAGDMRRNAEHLAQGARQAGFTTAELIETAGHPAVYAERMVDATLPTALIYGHHDVQPPDPLDEWGSPPFEPVVVEGELRCRGSADDKGQVWMHLKAVETYLQARGELPLNLKLIVEGEEEISSRHFEELIETHAEQLRADLCVVSDTAMHGRGQPSLCVGLRGVVELEVEVTGPSLDLHSGEFGGAVLNPAEALVRILASLRDPSTGRINVPGFYDGVVELSPDERAQIAAAPFEEVAFRELAGGVPATYGESGYTTTERRTVRPTLEINGIFGGYQGPGGKTIIPSRAGAKLTCRLVPRQRPDDVAARVRAAVEAATPEAVRSTVRVGGGSHPVVTPTDHPGVRSAARAMRDVFGAEPYLTREGGSIHPVEMFDRRLGLPTVLVGLGLPDDRIHAPNEKFDLGQYSAGIRVLTRLWEDLARSLPRPDPATR
ncbi:MAG TPA: dipeptidase [Candidatus Binatia bacterium]|nr:dipeptidase [Candidatus Binatia bacterium]